MSQKGILIACNVCNSKRISVNVRIKGNKAKFTLRCNNCSEEQVCGDIINEGK